VKTKELKKVCDKMSRELHFRVMSVYTNELNDLVERVRESYECGGYECDVDDVREGIETCYQYLDGDEDAIELSVLFGDLDETDVK